jgi:O-antigen/teichoic acid export membrane protein
VARSAGAIDAADALTTVKNPRLGEGLTGFVRLLWRAGIVLAIQVLGAGVSYALQVGLARMLGASDYGLYSALFVWIGFVALIVGVGFPAGAVRFIPHYRAQGDFARLHGFVKAAQRITLNCAAGITLLSLSVIAGLRLADVVSEPSSFVLAALVVPAFAGSTLYTELERSQGRVGTAFGPALVARPLLTGIVAAALFLAAGKTLSTDGALIATLAAGYAVFGCQWWLARSAPVRALPRPEARTESREWFGVGFSLLAASAFSLLLMQVDIVLVAAMRGSTEAGIYTAASKTATLVTFVIWAVNAAAVPEIASLWSLGKLEELRRMVARLAGVIFWPSLAISIGLAALSGPVLMLFGAQFSAARDALLILLVAQLVNAAAGPVGYLLILTGHHREATAALAASALAAIAMTTVGIATLGLTGAALGTTAGFMLWNGALYRLVVVKIGVRASIFDAIFRQQTQEGGR